MSQFKRKRQTTPGSPRTCGEAVRAPQKWSSRVLLKSTCSSFPGVIGWLCACDNPETVGNHHIRTLAIFSDVVSVDMRLPTSVSCLARAFVNWFERCGFSRPPGQQGGPFFEAPPVLGMFAPSCGELFARPPHPSMFSAPLCGDPSQWIALSTVASTVNLTASSELCEGRS